MKKFLYIIRFYKRNDKYHININLDYRNYLIPVFYRSFICDKKENSKIFNQIYNYFNQTHIKMTKTESHLLYNVFKHDDLILPNPSSYAELNANFRMTKGLTTKEILFLIYINKKSVSGKIAKYWQEQYNLDAEYTIKHLIYLNYLTTDDFRANLERATKKELSEILKEYNISTNGKKSELVKLVKENVPIDKQKEYFSGLYYIQTIKGEQIALNYQCLNDFHKSYYRYAHQLKIEEFYLLSKLYKDLEAKDVCKMMIDSKNSETNTNFDWGKTTNNVGNEKEEVKEFEEIVNKNVKSVSSVKSDISDDLFFSIINKKEKKEPNESNDLFYQIINKNFNKTTKEVINEKFQKETIEVDIPTPENKCNHDHKLLFTFIKSLVYSSILCVITIYIIFQYIIA